MPDVVPTKEKTAEATAEAEKLLKDAQVFFDEYQALCKKHGFSLQPKIKLGFDVVKTEEKKEEK